MASVSDFLVDFSKEEEGGGGGARYKPGTYKVKIVKGKTGVSENKSTPYLEVTYAFLEGKERKGKKKISDRIFLTPKAIKRLRLLMQACGIKVTSKTKADVTKLIPKLKGKVLWIELEDEEREGYSTRSRVSFEGFIAEDDFDPEDVEDEDEEDEDEEDDDEDDDEEEDDEDDDDDEDDEDEEEPPKRKSKKAPAKKKSSSKKSSKAKKSSDDDDDDLEDLDLDDL